MEDPVYLSDELVLRRMLDSETHHGMGSYFDSRLQKDFNENDRQELAIWMRDVCRAEECQPDIFPLSIQIVDRFLSFVRTKRSQLQLLGAVAMFTASKLRQTRIIPARNLIYYTQDLLTLQELRTWELFVLTTLKWDIALITPVDYLDILLRRVKLPDDDDLTSEIEYEAHKLIHECCLEIATSCLARAMDLWLNGDEPRWLPLSNHSMMRARENEDGEDGEGEREEEDDEEEDEEDEEEEDEDEDDDEEEEEEEEVDMKPELGIYEAREKPNAKTFLSVS